MARQASRRFGLLVQSDIRRMTRECERVGGINLGQGICDLPTPLPVAEGAIEAIRGNRATYTPFEGLAGLRQQIARFLDAEGFRVDPVRELAVTVGSSGALSAAMIALLDPGDEILLFEPWYGYHRHQAEILGLRVRTVPLVPGSWRLDREKLEAAIGPKSRAIVVNTPANPSGMVFDRSELEFVAGICRRHDLLAVTDEIYDRILFDGREHLRLARFSEMWERTVTISGFSKTFSITGWRLGWAAGPAGLVGPLGLATDLLAICAPTPLQWGVAKGLAELPPRFYSDLAADYQRKRDRFMAALVESGFRANPPEGAYYVLADHSAFGFASAAEAARSLLEEGRVAAIPGTAFFDGETGERYLRFCFGKDEDVLVEAGRRIVEWGKGRRRD
jgi:aminotransferase